MASATAGDAPEGGAGATLEDALRSAAAPLLAACEWRAQLALRGVSRASRAALAGGGCRGDAGVADEGPLWPALCASFARDHALHCPEAHASSWKSVFFDILWPARHKWDASAARESAASDFKVKVSARFKPGSTSRRALVLPLHQRLKLLKKGEVIGREEAAAGLPPDAVEGLVEAAAGGNLSPEAMEALIEAQALLRMSSAASAAAAAEDAAARRAALSGSDDDSAGAGGEADGEAAGDETSAKAAVSADTGGGVAQPVGGGKARSSGENKENEHNGNGDGGQHRAGARVLAVRDTSVATFVPGAGIRCFSFAAVFDGSAPQEAVYWRACRDAVLCAVNGHNACVICYGQTGSGKTHTSFGPPGALQDARRALRRQSGRLLAGAGAVPRAGAELLAALSASAANFGARASVTAQYVQVYKERLYDLLGDEPHAAVSVRDTGDPARPVKLVGAREAAITTLDELLGLLERGERNKRYAETAMNHRSSRAHTVLLLDVEQAKGDALVRSTLSLCDLAGSEQLKQSRAEGATKAEAIAINRSLSCLGRCVRALAAGANHVPFRESVLTSLLRAALGGSARLSVVVAASRDERHGEQTLSTLRFGEQASMVTNSVVAGVGSAAEAQAEVERALATVKRAMHKLEVANRTHLPAYRALQQRHAAAAARLSSRA